MPDPAEPSPKGPEVVGSETHAPQGLRRRVLARVRAEPVPIRSGASHSLRLLAGGRRARLLATLTAAGAVVVAAILIFTGGSGTFGRTRLAHGLGAARASLRRVDGHAELRLSAMPLAPVGEVYEVWLSGPGSKPRPTNTLFNVTLAGTAAVEVPGDLHGVHRVTVTAEPVGGSPRPTSPVVLTVALPGN